MRATDAALGDDAQGAEIGEVHLPEAKAGIELIGVAPGRAPTGVWTAMGFGLALLATAAAIAGKGLDREGIELGLRLTARLAFLAFWPCYAAGALVVLFGRGFEPLKRRARALGLTFAAVMAVHLGLVLALSAIGAPPAAGTIIVFAPGAVCAVLLAAASLDPVSRTIGPHGWWLLRNVAMNYIMLDFLLDFVRREAFASTRTLVAYLPFAALAAAGPILRLAAFIRPRRAAAA
jgi:hypothetical protein